MIRLDAEILSFGAEKVFMSTSNGLKPLEAARRARGWSKAELARRAHLNQVTVGAIELGRLVPYPGQLKKLARALGVDVTDLGGVSE